MSNRPTIRATGHEAVFRRPLKDGKHWNERFPVVAWSDTGDALVLHDSCLVVASSLPQFKWIDERPRVVGIAPGGGWRIERDCLDGVISDQPLIGWVLRADGSCSPIEAMGDGETVESSEISGEYVIYHPSETPQTHRLANRDQAAENGKAR